MKDLYFHDRSLAYAVSNNKMRILSCDSADRFYAARLCCLDDGTQALQMTLQNRQ